jgi:DsbC/DsbD-like thiol-disulfide interchange protein
MKAFFLYTFLFIGFVVNSQEEITWDFSYNKNSQQLEIEANLASGWHIYSTDLGDIAGPISTDFEFKKNKDVTLIGKVKEPQPKVEFDPNFEETVKYFDKQVVFVQKVGVKKNTLLKGGVVYMICNDTICLPPVLKEFEIQLKK